MRGDKWFEWCKQAETLGYKKISHRNGVTFFESAELFLRLGNEKDFFARRMPGGKILGEFDTYEDVLAAIANTPA